MKLFQADTEGNLSAGIAVRRDESHRPYIFVGADLTVGPSIGVKNPSREVGKRVYLTGALWQDVCKKCDGGSEFVYEADSSPVPTGPSLWVRAVATGSRRWSTALSPTGSRPMFPTPASIRARLSRSTARPPSSRVRHTCTRARAWYRSRLASKSPSTGSTACPTRTRRPLSSVDPSVRARSTNGRTCPKRTQLALRASFA